MSSIYIKRVVYIYIYIYIHIYIYIAQKGSKTKL